MWELLNRFCYLIYMISLFYSALLTLCSSVLIFERTARQIHTQANYCIYACQRFSKFYTFLVFFLFCSVCAHVIKHACSDDTVHETVCNVHVLYYQSYFLTYFFKCQKKTRYFLKMSSLCQVGLWIKVGI